MSPVYTVTTDAVFFLPLGGHLLRGQRFRFGGGVVEVLNASPRTVPPGRYPVSEVFCFTLEVAVTPVGRRRWFAR